MKEAQVDTIQNFQKHVCLVLDEVRVNSHAAGGRTAAYFR